MTGPILDPTPFPPLDLLPPVAKVGDVYKFTGAAGKTLQASIDRVLDTMPEDASAVILDVAAGLSERTVTSVVAIHTKSEWDVLLGVALTYEGEFDAALGVQARKVFR